MISPLNNHLYPAELGLDGSKTEPHGNLRKVLLGATALVAVSASMSAFPVDQTEAQTVPGAQLVENVEFVINAGSIVSGAPGIMGSVGADTLTVNTGAVITSLTGTNGVAIDFVDGDDRLTINMNNAGGNRLVLAGAIDGGTATIIGGTGADTIIFNVGADGEVAFRANTDAGTGVRVGFTSIESLDFNFLGDNNPTLTLSSPVSPTPSASRPTLRASGTGTIRNIIESSNIILGTSESVVVLSQTPANSTGMVTNLYETREGSSIYQNNGQSVVSIMYNGHFTHRGTINAEGVDPAIMAGNGATIIALGAGSIAIDGTAIQGGDSVAVNIVGDSAASPFTVSGSLTTGNPTTSGIRLGDQARVSAQNFRINGGGGPAITIGDNGSIIAESGVFLGGDGIVVGNNSSIVVTGNSSISGGSGTAVILGSEVMGSSFLQIDEGSTIMSSSGTLVVGGAGNDTIALNLASPSMIQGIVSGGDGMDRAIFTYNGDSRATIAVVYESFESIVKRGRGTLIQTTNNGAVPADLVIEEGGLLLGAGASLSINNVITLNRDDAVFGGIGTVTADVSSGTTINGGILSPGLSVGTITFTNGLTLSPTTRLAFDLDPANMQADLITVTSGNVILMNNPVVVSYKSVPDMAGTPDLTVLSVAPGGSVTGTLGAATGTYIGTGLSTVILNPIVSFDDDTNPQQIVIQTETLPTSDARVTPGSYASAMAALSRIQSQVVFDSVEENRPTVQYKPGLAVWTDGFYANAQRDGNDGRNRGYSADFYGALVGLDAIVTGHVGIGGFVGYSGGDYTARNDLSGNQNYDALVLGGYSRYQNDYLRADAVISYSTGDVDATRRANAATYESSYGLDVMSLGGRLGVPLFRGSALSVEPHAMIQYINTSRSQFSERITSQNPSSTANNFRLHTVFSQDYEELLMGAGVRLEYRVAGDSLPSIRGVFDIGWQEEVLSNRPEVVASTGGNQRFVNSASAANGGALGVAVGVAVGVTDQLSLWVNYDGRYDFTSYQQHGVLAGMSYRL